mgnify:CR=1 FL=1
MTWRPSSRSRTDGCFAGARFGAAAERVGEVVFNTSMTGYQEILSDPSYRGQIVVMTLPEIGNVGTNADDAESGAPQVEGFVVRELSLAPANWRSTQALHEYLREHGLPGISRGGHPRDHAARTGARRDERGALEPCPRTPTRWCSAARQAPELRVAAISCARVTHGRAAPLGRLRATRLGRRPSARSRIVLACAASPTISEPRGTSSGCSTSPASTSPSSRRRFRRGTLWRSAPRPSFSPTAPAIPATATYADRGGARARRSRADVRICLGHQIAALAIGAKTIKLKFGHRGANHPVRDLRTGRVAVTAQNHGYAVAAETLPPGAQITHVSLNDGTCEGFFDESRQLLAVQYHPESSPGPHDALNLFGEFRRLVDRERSGSAAGKGAR